MFGKRNTGICKTEVVQSKYDWSTKEGRLTWETDMDEQYLSSKIQERQTFFDHCEEMLCNDESIGSDMFLKSVFKKDLNSEVEFSIAALENSPCVWQQRTKVTFDHFIQEFHALKDKNRIMFNGSYLVLDKFLQQESSLSLIRHIPDILHMQNILIAKYGKKITREEAEKISLQDCLEDFKKDSAQRDEVGKGLSSFCKVWNNLRHSLLLFPGENKELQEILSRDIKEDTVSVKAVLTDTKGIGACSGILLEFLIEKQNEFLNACGSKIYLRLAPPRTVSVKDLTSIDLITFKREADIFPIILANCNYTYMQDKGTKLEYDVENIQAVLIDRFLYGKPVIDTSMGFPTMTYKAETTLSAKISTLSNKIPQKAINVAVQSQIAEEFGDLTELYETISNIDIVVNFLLSGNFSEDIQLNVFMAETLQMKPLASSKAAQCCKLSHVQSLWFLLTHEKTKRLHESQKEAFDSVNDSIKDILSNESAMELDSYLNEFSFEKLVELMEQLMEFIIFSLNCGEYDRASLQYSLSECLLVHIESPVFPEETLRSLRPADLERLPGSILSVHSVDVWKRIHKTVRSRK